VTFGALAYSWTEVLIEALADACLNDAAFRESLPVGFANSGASKADLEEKFQELVGRFSRTARLEPALSSISDKFVRGRRALIPRQRDQLAKLSVLNAESTVGCRPGLIYRCQESEDSFVLQCHSSEIRFPLHVGKAVTYALETAQFRVRDIPAPIDDAGKLVLTRRLIREGLLMVLR
jgi:hypothetical protein